jgi:hypothetical protein
MSAILALLVRLLVLALSAGGGRKADALRRRLRVR